MDIKICSFNVNGLGDQRKREKVFNWLKQNNFSICFLQELHCTQENTDKWKKQWDNEIFLSGNSSNSIGIGILLNLNTTYEILENREIIQGRLQLLKLKVHDSNITLLNIYAPNTDDINFFTTIEDIVIEHNSESLILGGDFNNVINVELDKLNGRKDTNKRCSAKIGDIINNNELYDIYRVRYPNTKRFTWHSNHRPPIFCRLDYFLTSANLLNAVTRCNIIPGFLSDHSAITLNINMCETVRGPGYYKLNNSILLQPEYKQKIKDTIQETEENNRGCNPNTMWEIIKGAIRNESIKYSSKLKKTQRESETKIESEIKRIEKQIVESPNNQDLADKLKGEYNKLNVIIEEKTKGLLLRSKAEWVEGAEKNTKYFANLERKRSEERSIKQLTINNILENDHSNIMKHIKQYYQHIYSEDLNIDHNDNGFFNNTDTKLNNDENMSCEGRINEYECLEALKEMKNMKSPGSDGLTAEFYKLYWNDIKEHYINSINYSFENGTLTELQKQGIITLLPKKDKNTLLIENWRPISLLNVDYKIATKTIANRIKRVLNSLINVNQTGFIKGRYIGENVRTIIELIEETNENNKPGLIFFADFQKAFDSLNHKFIMKCLSHLNFGESLIQWVSLFYNDGKSCISNNGHLSEFFNVKKGVRQGCPLSAYIFILCIELLSRNINSNTQITGLSLAGKEIKQTLFADDASFSVDGSEKSFKELIKTLEKFALISGLKLNKTKCTILKIGTLKDDKSQWCNTNLYTWSNDQASTLGITFTNDKTKLHSLNLIPKIKSFKHCLSNWKKWNLTLIGKITVLKTFAFPKLVYTLTVLENPSEEIIKEINNTMYDFLWDGKPDKISRKTIIQKYENFGLKMINVQSFIHALKISWIKRLKGAQNQWKHAYNKELNKHGGDLMFKCNLKHDDTKHIVKKYRFLNEILISWCKVNFKDAATNICNEILWHNTNLKDGYNKTILYKDWYNKGIMYIKQIYDYRVKEFYRFNELTQLYDLNEGDFLKYYALKNNIKNEWKVKLKTEDINNNPPNLLITRVLSAKKTNKIVYNIQIESMKLPTLKHVSKWENELGIQDIQWKNIFSLPYKCTISTKLREFQYKYLMRIIPNNSFLFKCHIKPSNLCDFCHMSIDSNKHMFWECTVIQHFWSNINQLLQSTRLDYNTNLTYECISFCNTNIVSKQKAILASFIILLAKYFIFKCKCNATIPTLDAFNLYLKATKKIEETIATMKNKLDVYNLKWNDYNL